MNLNKLASTTTSDLKAALLTQVAAVFTDLYQLISSYEEKDINRIPFEGSWTPGQVCEHIFKSVSGLPQLCSGRTESVNRPLNEKVQAFEELFLDFNQKFESPDFILPSNKAHSRTGLLSVFKEIEASIVELIRTQDLSLLCLDFELPGSGLLTRYEWLRFALVHMQRHLHQLKNILNHFKH